LLDTPAKKQEFLDIYTAQGKEAGREYLRAQGELLGRQESETLLDHRIYRYSANPCFAPGTMVLTREGHFPIESLVDKEVEVFDGTKWVKINNFRVTGNDQDVYDVELRDGSIITATAYHTFILSDGTRKQLKDLVAGDELLNVVNYAYEGVVQAKGGYLKGFLIGDGTSCKGKGAMCKVYAPKQVCVERLGRCQVELGALSPHVLTPAGYLRNLTTLNEDMNPWCYKYKHEFPYEVLDWTTEAKAEFLAGLFDADGTALDTKNGFSYQFTSVSRPFLEGLVVLLRTLGVPSKIGHIRQQGFYDFGPERGGLCRVKDAYRLTIPQRGAVKLGGLCRFERLKNLGTKKLTYKVQNKTNRVKTITFARTEPEVFCCTVPKTHSFTLSSGIVVGQCHEINGNNFQCNLGEVHLNTIDPKDKETQHKAFYSTGLLTSTLLQHKFTDPQLQFSREVDPIVAVCLSGLFDFFVHALGIDWVRWMIAGRPDNAQGRKFCKKEVQYLESWKESARQGVYDYCTQAGIKMPNRYTAVQPSGSKALLTGASSGWHPPKAAWFIRRITFGVNDPLVSALRDWGYNVVPAQSARDELGNLLDDISDPRVSEVLVEIPTKVSWADLPGAEECDLSQIPATSQMELYMQVQRYYSTHTTSATVEFRENEIEDLAKSIHTQIQEDRGYIGVALLARFDDSATFPRLPFEPITKEEYERLQDNVHSWRTPEDENLGFLAVLNRYDNPDYQLVPEAACTSAACIAKADDDERQGKPQ
jgi:ribonucleotide reductase, class II